MIAFFLKKKLNFQNTADFIQEIISSLGFFVDYIRGKPSTSSKKGGSRDGSGKTDFGNAFGVTPTTKEQPTPITQMTPEFSGEQAVLLEPYPFNSSKSGDI